MSFTGVCRTSSLRVNRPLARQIFSSDFTGLEKALGGGAAERDTSYAASRPVVFGLSYSPGLLREKQSSTFPRGIDKVQAKPGECPALQTLRDQPSGVGTGEAFGVRGMPALSGTQPICRRRGE